LRDVVSGASFAQVADPDPDAVPVDVPETEMTNAPPQEGEPTPEE